MILVCAGVLLFIFVIFLLTLPPFQGLLYLYTIPSVERSKVIAFFEGAPNSNTKSVRYRASRLPIQQQVELYRLIINPKSKEDFLRQSFIDAALYYSPSDPITFISEQIQGVKENINSGIEVSIDNKKVLLNDILPTKEEIAQKLNAHISTNDTELLDSAMDNLDLILKRVQKNEDEAS